MHIRWRISQENVTAVKRETDLSLVHALGVDQWHSRWPLEISRICDQSVLFLAVSILTLFCSATLAISLLYIDESRPKPPNRKLLLQGAFIELCHGNVLAAGTLPWTWFIARAALWLRQVGIGLNPFNLLHRWDWIIDTNHRLAFTVGPSTK